MNREDPPQVSDGLLTLLVGMGSGFAAGLFYRWIWDQVKAIWTWGSQ
jgi:hypothetical protein